MPPIETTVSGWKNITLALFPVIAQIRIFILNIYNPHKMSLAASVSMHGGVMGRTFAKKMSTFVLLHSF